MTTSIWPRTLFPRRKEIEGERGEKRKKLTENTKAHSWILQEELCKDENIWKRKARAQLHFPTINCGISAAQYEPKVTSVCAHIWAHTRGKQWTDLSGFFLPPHSSISSAQLEESSSLKQLQADFYPIHITNFPLDVINTKQKRREQVLSCSVTALDRWRLKLVSRSRWKRGLCCCRSRLFIQPTWAWPSTLAQHQLNFSAGWSTEDFHSLA